MQEMIKIFIEDTSGERYECDISPDTKLSEIAFDFFEDRNWPTTDSQGRGQRAVVELVDPENPDRTKRLNSEDTIKEAGLWEGAILRIFPESIAGVVDHHDALGCVAHIDALSAVVDACVASDRAALFVIPRVQPHPHAGAVVVGDDVVDDH